MPVPEPVSEPERRLIARFHAEGWSRNRIARELGMSGSTVSKVARELGLEFDRSVTAVATAARVADAKASRAELQEMYLLEAQELLLEIRRPVEYVDHGGRDFRQVRWQQLEPSIIDKLKLMQASATAADRALKLAEHDAESGVEPVKSMLGALAEVLGVGMPVPEDPPGPASAT